MRMCSVRGMNKAVNHTSKHNVASYVRDLVLTGMLYRETYDE
jgi:hypothetical protein